MVIKLIYNDSKSEDSEIIRLQNDLAVFGIKWKFTIHAPALSNNEYDHEICFTDSYKYYRKIQLQLFCYEKRIKFSFNSAYI